jgi:hypothetical protein
MSNIPRDPIGAANSYHANITINAPIDTVFAAVSPVAGLSGCWTTDTGGSPEPGGEQHIFAGTGVKAQVVARNRRT